ncbi:MAG TPA: glycosyltransferase family 4 protein, partial [Ktedonobacteraceae bacterium]|nr:glycosyltransferase family 4 protein [Ktedonobacteraceae bacterium]
MKTKIRVLFLQSVTQGRSIEDVHSMLARHFNRDHVEIYVACDKYISAERTATYRMFEAIPEAHIRPTNFGRPVLNGSKLDIAGNMLFTGLALAGSLAGLIGYIKQHHINIIHTADRRDVLCGVLLARLTGARCIVHLHQNCGGWMNPVSLWALRQADGIVGVSQFTAQSAPTVGCRPARIYHALNGVDSTRWNCDADGSSIRREFAMPTDIPVFAIIARAVPWKGHELLLQALSTIKEELPDFRLLVVGKDDPRSLPKGSRSYLA